MFRSHKSSDDITAQCTDSTGLLEFRIPVLAPSSMRYGTALGSTGFCLNEAHRTRQRQMLLM